MKLKITLFNSVIVSLFLFTLVSASHLLLTSQSNVTILSLNYWDQTSQSDFEGGTITNLDTTTTSGDLMLTGAYFSDVNTVSLWHLNENTGASITDLSGNGNNGNLNGPVWTSGKYGPGLQFDGVDDYVEVSDSSSLHVTNQITVEAWIKPSQTIDSTNSNMRIVDKQNAYYLLFDYPTADGKLKLILRIGGTYVSVSSVTNSWNASQWYHIAGTYDGSTMKIYVNGVLENSKSQTGSIEASNYKLFFGTRSVSDVPTNMYFNGIIDEVRISNIPRTFFPVTYFISGNLISSVHNTGFSPAKWTTIKWTSTTPSGTNIKMRTRTSNDTSTWSDWSSNYTNPTGSLITSPYATYIQYQAFLETTDTSQTPVLHDVRISYHP